MKAITLRMDDEMAARVDAERGAVKREPWIRECIALRLAEIEAERQPKEE